MRRIAAILGTLLAVLAGGPPVRADYLSTVLDSSVAVGSAPYMYAGIIYCYGSGYRGSGAVVGSTRLVMSCAHVPFSDTSYSWTSDNVWFRAYESSSAPTKSAGQVLRGYYYFSTYASLARSSGSSAITTFAVDTVGYYGYEDLGPDSPGFWQNGQEALVLPASKTIVGYPAGLYSSTSTLRNLMHQSGPFNLAFTQIWNNYYEINGVGTGSGNSGGPVYVIDESSMAASDQGYRYAAVLVSGSLVSEGDSVNSTGVVAVNSSGWYLANEALAAIGLAPLNDSFSAAMKLTGSSATDTGLNTYATTETGEPSHAGGSGGHSLWWRWTAPGAGSVTVSTSGSSFDTLLGVYTGSSVSALTTIASNDDASSSATTSSTTFTATSGTEYFIAVDGKSSATGTVSLSVSFTPTSAPPNDAFASATTISGYSARALGYNISASKETGEPNHGSDAGGKSVWWTWTAPAAGSVYVTTSGTAFDTLLGVYTGTAVSSLTTIASNDDPTDLSSTYNDSSAATFTATSGTTYYIAVDGYSAQTGAIILTLNLTPTSPVIVTQPTGQTVASGSAATLAVVARGAATLSYQWSKGGTSISGATSATYTISSFASSDEGSYAVTVSNSAGSVTSSTAVLALEGSVPTVSTQASSQSVTAGTSATFTVAATSTTTMSYQWQRLASGTSTWENLSEGGSYSGTTTATLTVSGTTAGMSGDQFRCVITNGSGSTTSTAATLTVTSSSSVILQYPAAISQDSSGNLYVADSAACVILKVSSSGTVSTLAGSSGSSGSTDDTGTAARFNQPGGIIADTSGNVYVADTGNATIRKITTAGVVTTLAGSTSSRGTRDGSGTAAWFSSPTGLAVDTAATVYVADTGAATVRKITASGAVSTVAGMASVRGEADGTGTAALFNYPGDVAVDTSGNLFVADTYNDTIRKITSSGVVSTLAGSAGISGSTNGTGTYALFNQPYGVAVDSSGNVYVADTGNGTIRCISSAGVVTTVAGITGVAGLKDGAGTNALFNQPRSLALDSSGNLYVADTGNATIRKIASDATVSTVSLTSTSSSSSSTSSSSSSSTSSSSSAGGGGGGAIGGGFVLALALLALAGAPKGSSPQRR